MKKYFYTPELWRAIRNRKDLFMELTKEKAQEIMDQNDGNLDLYMRWEVTKLPDNLTVGGSLYLSGCTGIQDKRKERRKVKSLRNGDYVAGRYIFCDNMLTHIKKVKQVGAYTLYIGKIPGKNVVSDGTNYAHCKKLRDGIADLAFKSAVDRGADQYKGLSLDTELTVAEAVTMYRIITGACRQGSESFVNSLGDLKEKYTIRECIHITKGQYNAEKFAEFFGEG